MDEMTVPPLMHSLPLWYYPRQVADAYTDLETAARGYAKHLDTFNPTKGFKRKLDKLENQKADDGEFPLGNHSDCHSLCFSRWSQGQEGKVNSQKKGWPIQQQGTAMNPCCKVSTFMGPKTSIYMGPCDVTRQHCRPCRRTSPLPHLT